MFSVLNGRALLAERFLALMPTLELLRPVIVIGNGGGFSSGPTAVSLGPVAWSGLYNWPFEFKRSLLPAINQSTLSA